jgi:hypothetical protein
MVAVSIPDSTSDPIAELSGALGVGAREVVHWGSIEKAGGV